MGSAGELQLLPKLSIPSVHCGHRGAFKLEVLQELSFARNIFWDMAVHLLLRANVCCNYEDKSRARFSVPSEPGFDSIPSEGNGCVVLVLLMGVRISEAARWLHGSYLDVPQSLVCS